MRLFFVLGAIFALVSGASAQTVVADFGGDFQGPTPKSGWSYLWNPAGQPLSSSPGVGNVANWASLSYNSTNTEFETASSGSLPHTGDGGYLSVFSTGVRVGQTAATTPASSDGNSHYAILAFTFTPAEVAADGPYLFFHTYNFSAPTDATLGPIDVQVYKNSGELAEFGFPAGESFSDSTYGTNYFFGTVAGGDTLYIALGDTSTYSGQSLGVAYTLALSQTPEPASLGLLCFAGVLLARRRR